VKKSLDMKRVKIEDFIFFGKNKDFGAYVLRQRSQRNLMIGAFSGMLLTLAVYAIPLLMSLFNSETDEVPIRQVEAQVTPYSELMAPPPLPLEPKPPEAVIEPPQVATRRFVKPELRPDEEVKDEELMPTLKELKSANPGRETKEGTGDIHAVYVPRVVVDTVVKTAPPPAPKPPPPPKEEIYSYVERFPEFPGGEEEMQRFIARNIVYPAAALDVGIEGVVVVQFVVDKKGVIKDPVVVRDIGGGCGQEAINVVLKMPHWIPGEQNGLPVSVRYTLPVRFKMIQ
jgi:periplasmic protein TonB